MKCRHCKAALTLPMLELGSAPPSNAYLTTQALSEPETWFPLRVLVCQNCWLAQTEDHAGREALFSDEYAYFSSFSRSWLAHARQYMVDMHKRFALGLGMSAMVVEVAANDGYLLQYATELGLQNYGIEPTASTAAAARAKGIDIIEKFFGVALAKKLVAQGREADLMVANNVLAHVPEIDDFVAGFAVLLKPQGVATFEFPHLLRMVQDSQFDTAYHEHYSYLSLTAVRRIFAANGLAVFDVQALPTHGGSLRVFAQRQDTGRHVCQPSVARTLQEEQSAGMLTSEFYSQFGLQPMRIAGELLSFLISARTQGHRVAAYGAAAKGNTLLNFAGVRPHWVPYVVDLNPAKQDKFMPGSRIPIVAEAVLRADQPTHVLILPWNLKDEVMAQLDYIREWGGKFVVTVPTLQVLP